jgi:thiamine transport system ATP-binding protein
LTITFDNLHLSHGTFSLRADCEIESGHKIALLGPSGGGKSTLLSAIAGFKVEETGRLLHRGKDITHMPPAARPVTLLFQDHNLFPHMTVYQNVALGLRPDLRLSAEQIDTTHAAMDRVGLSGMDKKLPSQLSGGQQQRVALARALLRHRPILLLDEPFAALGPALKHDMLDLVREIVDGTDTTMIMVTHQPEDAEYLCDQTMLIADGIAHAPVPTQDLLANPPDSLAEYLGTKKGT